MGDNDKLKGCGRCSFFSKNRGKSGSFRAVSVHRERARALRARSIFARHERAVAVSHPSEKASAPVHLGGAFGGAYRNTLPPCSFARVGFHFLFFRQFFFLSIILSPLKRTGEARVSSATPKARERHSTIVRERARARAFCIQQNFMDALSKVVAGAMHACVPRAARNAHARARTLVRNRELYCIRPSFPTPTPGSRSVSRCVAKIVRVPIVRTRKIEI